MANHYINIELGTHHYATVLSQSDIKVCSSCKEDVYGKFFLTSLEVIIENKKDSIEEIYYCESCFNILKDQLNIELV